MVLFYQKSNIIGLVSLVILNCFLLPQSCINVVLGFVSPENVGECIRLTQEVRLLSQDLVAAEDKLEVLLLFHVSQSCLHASVCYDHVSSHNFTLLLLDSTTSHSLLSL